jgi:hypothetical protein
MLTNTSVYDWSDLALALGLDGPAGLLDEDKEMPHATRVGGVMREEGARVLSGIVEDLGDASNGRGSWEMWPCSNHRWSGIARCPSLILAMKNFLRKKQNASEDLNRGIPGEI